MKKVKVEIEIPDGYELKYPDMRAPEKGERFATDPDTVYVAADDSYCTCWPIVQPITPPWEWPAWLKAPWIAMDRDGDWYAYDEEPDDDAFRVGGDYFVWLNDMMLDITFPPVTDWKKSKMKNPRGVSDG